MYMIFSQKRIIIRGVPESIKEKLKKYGFKWNFRLRGWVYYRNGMEKWNRIEWREWFYQLLKQKNPSRIKKPPVYIEKKIEQIQNEPEPWVDSALAEVIAEISIQDLLGVYLDDFELFDYLTEFQSIRELGFWVLCKGLGVSAGQLGKWYKMKYGKPYSQLKNSPGWYCLEDGKELTKGEALNLIKEAISE